MSPNRVIKIFHGYPCAHRQWKHDGHCAWIHGYQRHFVVHFVADSLDERGWVIDFGGVTMKGIKKMLDHHFDHTLLLASDDPEIEHFRKKDGKLCKLIELPYGPGMEGTARWLLGKVNTRIKLDEELTQRGVRCYRVECWENEKNAGVWEIEE
jgi:6-pyruvoyltetrahydropterin/6-carboxytetrahydropterin synthase